MLNFLAKLCFALVLVCSFPGEGARAQTPPKHDHSQLGPAGKLYERWKQPGSRAVDGDRLTSCCDEKDCEPATIVRVDGKLYVRNHKMAPGRDVLLPDGILEHNQPDPEESPDGLPHVCMNTFGMVLCAMLGSGT